MTKMSLADIFVSPHLPAFKPYQVVLSVRPSAAGIDKCNAFF